MVFFLFYAVFLMFNHVIEKNQNCMSKECTLMDSNILGFHKMSEFYIPKLSGKAFLLMNHKRKSRLE